MTVGLLLPIVLLVLGIGEAILFRQLSLRGIMTDRIANALILLSLLFPLAGYGLLNFVFAELGAMTVF